MCLYINGEKNVTFIHIPKTAGTSITEWLINNRGNSTYIELASHPTHSQILEKYERNFSFAVVRNPWDRLVSLYHFLKNILIDEDSHLAVANDYTKENFPSFEHWITHIEDMVYPEDIWYTILTPQQTWLNPNVDLLIRFENLTEEFRQVQDLYNVTKPLPHLFNSKHLNYRNYYNDSTKKIVERLCERDIELFKYQY